MYDSTQRVSYMSSNTKKACATLYSAWGFGGTTDWSIDLQIFQDVPKPADSWAVFKQLIKSGRNPRAEHTRNGNRTKFYCTDPLVDDHLYYAPPEQYNGLNADAAWKDVVIIWKDKDRPRGGMRFSESVSETLNIGADANCGNLLADNCDQIRECG